LGIAENREKAVVSKAFTQITENASRRFETEQAVNMTVVHGEYTGNLFC
jgi:hypothetical protein